MSLKKVISHVFVTLLVLFSITVSLVAQVPAKNIIFMVPDGMGLSNVTAARIKKYGPDGNRLYLERLKQIGYQRTHSADSIVTDSAAAASAWAAGEKFENGEISQHGKGGFAPRTILELAISLGKATGLVATSTITHATPAAFGAHIHSRGCENEIARQFIMETGVDVLLGGGKSKFRSTKPDPCGVRGDWITQAKAKGYKVAFTRQKLLNLSNPPKLLGLFADRGMTPKIDKRENSTEPTLAEMTQKALDILELNPNGFFLMVEGSQIDWANHANDLKYQIGETLAFDQAVKVVLNWLKISGQVDETLLIIVPDHDCGGMQINGPYGSTFKIKGHYIEAGWTSRNHTGVDTLIWSQGPYSGYLGAALDNTHIYFVMEAAFLGLVTVEFEKPRY